MRQEGLKPSFDALPYTILNAADYYDHHLLFHLFLVPFAPVDPAADGGAALTLGAKIAAVLLPALGVVALWWLLRGQRAPYAAVWALGAFAMSSAFLYRMSMTRAQSGATAIWPLGLRDALPDIPIPLREPDGDSLLELGPALATVYDETGYDLSIDYTQPPPLPP